MGSRVGDGNYMQNNKLSFDGILTDREMEICGMIAKGLSNEHISKLLYLSEGTIKNHITSVFKKTGIQNRAQLVAVYVSQYENIVTDTSDVLGEIHHSKKADARLRLIGVTGLPNMIPLYFHDRSFSIGRFDVSVGQKQCDFELEKSTKAVSRRHASIERTTKGYFIVDLNSRAGTFVNGDKISGSYMLHNGDRVSFGTAGADYIFES
jgi:DNA-binding CsgD family transcriptional regulator